MNPVAMVFNVAVYPLGQAARIGLVAWRAMLSSAATVMILDGAMLSTTTVGRARHNVR